MSEKGKGKREKSRSGMLAQQSEIYQLAIDVLTSQGKFYINLGLERVQSAFKLLGNPQKRLQFVHVAGTNGKGSVCAMLSAVLQEGKGKGERGKDFNSLHTSHFTLHTNKPKIGLFVSPHVFEYTERIKINDVEIDKDVFAQKVVEMVELTEKNNIHLTEFEILTVLALDYFAKNEVDIVVLETGLGGRLDATNVIEENLCSIITHIDFDHTERLGDTIEKISHEKAGIIKENCPVVISANNEGFDVIKKIAKEKNAQVFTAYPREKVKEEWLSLKGSYQKENLALVFEAIEVLKAKGFEITDEAIEKGLKNVKHPCRFEYLDKNILIDGAHNPNGTKVLRESLEEYFPDQKYRFVFGCLRNKDYPQMMKNLFRSGDEIYFYQFNNENSASFEELSKECEFSAKPFDNYRQCDELTVICGSLYMIKELFLKMGLK